MAKKVRLNSLYSNVYAIHSYKNRNNRIEGLTRLLPVNTTMEV